MMRKKLLPAVLLVLGMTYCTEAAEPLSKELEVLKQFEGQWKARTTIKPKNGDERTFEDESVMKWALGGSYLEDRVGGGPNESLIGYWSFDPQAKLYRAWYFQPGTSAPMLISSTYDEKTRTFYGEAKLGSGITMKSRHTFVDDDQFEWKSIVRNAEGETLTELQGMKVRKPAAP